MLTQKSVKQQMVHVQEFDIILQHVLAVMV
jgi:hypothetical protein